MDTPSHDMPARVRAALHLLHLLDPQSDSEMHLEDRTHRADPPRDPLMRGARNAALNLLRNYLNGEESLREPWPETDPIDPPLEEAA